MTEERYAVIVAGGKGLRMGGDIPKQFRLLKGKPILAHTLFAFYSFDPSISIILVLPGDHFAYWKKICENFDIRIPHQVVQGGKERFYSVKNGLELVPSGALVAIHDGVRPFVKGEAIESCFVAAKDKGGAVLALPLIESIRKVKENTSHAVARKDYVVVQTPQCFQSTLLKDAYRQDFQSNFTDDASVYESNGGAIHCVEGNRENIKLTSPFDLVVGEAIWESDKQWQY